MNDDAKPVYLRGRGSRGRGTTHHPAAGESIVQRPGRQNKAWKDQDAPATSSECSQHVATSNNQSRGNRTHKN